MGESRTFRGKSGTAVSSSSSPHTESGELRSQAARCEEVDPQPRMHIDLWDTPRINGRVRRSGSSVCGTQLG